MDSRFTKKELAARWGCSTRTVERHVRQFALAAAGFIGLQPVYEPAAVAGMEERRLAFRQQQAAARQQPNGHAPHPARAIITIKEAKRLARRKGAR